MNLCSSRNICFNWLIDPHPDAKLTASSPGCFPHHVVVTYPILKIGNVNDP